MFCLILFRLLGNLVFSARKPAGNLPPKWLNCHITLKWLNYHITPNWLNCHITPKWLNCHITPNWLNCHIKHTVFDLISEHALISEHPLFLLLFVIFLFYFYFLFLRERDHVIIISGPSHATTFGSSVLHPG